jgi:hypothetical protein
MAIPRTVEQFENVKGPSILASRTIHPDSYDYLLRVGKIILDEGFDETVTVLEPQEVRCDLIRPQEFLQSSFASGVHPDDIDFDGMIGYINEDYFSTFYLPGAACIFYTRPSKPKNAPDRQLYAATSVGDKDLQIDRVDTISAINTHMKKSKLPKLRGWDRLYRPYIPVALCADYITARSFCRILVENEAELGHIELQRIKVSEIDRV